MLGVGGGDVRVKGMIPLVLAEVEGSLGGGVGGAS